MIEAEGYGGRITFDGEIVTVTRRHFPEKGDVRFRASDVHAIIWKGARRFWNGEVRFVVPGASDVPQSGNYWTKTGKDERDRYALTFTVEQSETMRSLCDAIDGARGHGDPKMSG